MTATPKRKCPDCQGEMSPITLLDKTHPSGMHQRVEYALPGTQRSSSWLGGRFLIGGVVAAYTCGRCGRILLYGVPNQEQKEDH
jgi:hypothetical protein